MGRKRQPADIIRKQMATTTELTAVYVPQMDKIISFRSKYLCLLIDADPGKIPLCSRSDISGNWYSSFMRSERLDMSKNFVRISRSDKKTSLPRTCVMMCEPTESGVVYGVKYQFFNTLAIPDGIVTIDRKNALAWFSDDKMFPYAVAACVRFNINAPDLKIG